MIKLVKSTFYNEDEVKKKLVEFLMNSDILSMNEQCLKFEETFAEYQGCKYSVFVSSGSAANLVLIQSFLNLGLIKKGKRVGFSALTWATNVMPLIQLGLKPIAIDCDISTLNISPKQLEKKLSEIDMLFITNVLGFADDLIKIREMCKKNNVLLIEDNCESLGSEIGNQKLGNFGLASTFSFFVGHHLSTIEGGMVCTNDKDLYDMLKMVRAHGWDRNLDSKRQEELRKKYNVNQFYAKYTFYDLAYNTRPTEVNGFLGNYQLKYIDDTIGIREKNFKLFLEMINENEDCYSYDFSHMNRVSNMAMPVVYKTKQKFNKYKKIFEKNGVEIRPVIAGDITQQPFYKKYVDREDGCQNAQIIHSQGFYFPNNPEMKDSEIKLLTKLLSRNE